MSYGYYGFILFFFFKQKTAYEMRISDWSSDVCSSDLSSLGDDRRHAGCHGDHRPDWMKQPGRRERDADPVEQEGERDVLQHLGIAAAADQIGRASCRERGCQYV